LFPGPFLRSLKKGKRKGNGLGVKKNNQVKTAIKVPELCEEYPVNQGLG